MKKLQELQEEMKRLEFLGFFLFWRGTLCFVSFFAEFFFFFFKKNIFYRQLFCWLFFSLFGWITFFGAAFQGFLCFFGGFICLELLQRVARKVVERNGCFCVCLFWCGDVFLFSFWLRLGVRLCILCL